MWQRLLLLALLTLPLQADRVQSAPTQPGRPSMPGNRLLDDLRVDRLDAAAAGPVDGSVDTSRLHDELGRAAVSEDENPLMDIGRRMREVQALISRANSGGETQQRQQEIVDQLNALVEQARRSGGKSQPADNGSRQPTARQPVDQPKTQPGEGQRKQGSQPAQTADAKPGRTGAERPDMGQMRGVLKRLWGQLPQRAREQMLQLPVEQFLPKYEMMIEQYFKRLTEEKSPPRKPK